MGTTTTPNLGLIKPDHSESIKPNGPMPGWAAQNALNMDAIDAVFNSEADDSWALTWTADTTNPTLGSGGFVEGKYLRVWKKMVVVYFRIFTGGAGFNPGSGVYRLNLPFAVSSALDGMAPGLELALGRMVLRDNSSVTLSEIATIAYSVDGDNLFGRTEPGNWSHDTPFTVAQDDRFAGYWVYPTDAAV